MILRIFSSLNFNRGLFNSLDMSGDDKGDGEGEGDMEEEHEDDELWEDDEEMDEVDDVDKGDGGDAYEEEVQLAADEVS